MPLITIVIGTRPEAIKLAPVIKAFSSSKNFNVRIVLTGQHKEMVYQVLDLFNINAHNDLKLMTQDQTLTHITCSSLFGLEEDFKSKKPDLVFVQGDTSSAFSGCLAAFYNKIPIAHVEAGLRTEDKYNPYPEEVNRRLISQIADLHFAPTEKAKSNLINAGIKENIFVTGNTVIDALLSIADNVNLPKIKNLNWGSGKVILLTVHRRENWGTNLDNIVIAIQKIAQEIKDIYFLIPMHKNKKVRNIFKSKLRKEKNIFLIEPLNYDEQIAAIKGSYLVMTDSGGIQEEVPSLGKPVLILRNNTEREEAIDAGAAKLIGTQTETIIKSVKELIKDKKLYERMSKAINPFGDGKACERILDHSLQYLNSKKNDKFL